MDKLAAGIIDKLSIIGFFNVIISGGVLLYGFSPILGRYVPGIFYMQLGLQKDLEKGIIICLVCYIFGSALQSIQVLFFKGLKASVVNKCLSGVSKKKKEVQGNGILENKYKREGTVELADKLFADKKMGEFNPEDRARADRLNESAAFYEQLAVAFFTLVVAGLLFWLFARTNVLMYCIGYLVMGAIFTGRAYHCRLNWARTVLATYEVAADQDSAEEE